MLLLGAGLAVNTILGPLVVDAIDYPFTETVRNETLGLEVVSLLLIAPLAVLAGVLALRGHRAASLVAMGPAAYAAYMLVQYVLGPQYLTYQPAALLHTGLFVLSAALVLRAWQLTDLDWFPARSRAWAMLPLFFAAFALSRWGGALAGFPGNEPIPAAVQDATMYWSIFFLDLGFVIPIALATGVGLLLRQAWASKALYGVVGWFALVPPSVAAMAMVKVVRDDPTAVGADALVLAIAAVTFGAIAVWLYRPLFHGSAETVRDRNSSRPRASEDYSPTA